MITPKLNLGVFANDVLLRTFQSERSQAKELNSHHVSDLKSHKSFLSSYRSKNIESDLKTLNFIKQKLKCVSNTQVIPAFDKFFDNAQELTKLFESIKTFYYACDDLKLKPDLAKSSSEVGYFEIWDRLKSFFTNHLETKGSDRGTKSRYHFQEYQPTSRQTIEGEDCPTQQSRLFSSPSKHEKYRRY